MDVTGDRGKRHATDYYIELLEKSWPGSVGHRSSKLAKAVYYYLQTDMEGLRIAHTIDRELFGKTYYEKFGEFPPGGLPYELLKKPTETENTSLQPKLRPPPKSTQKFHFANPSMLVLGRTDERRILEEFTRSGPGFRWLQLAGESGQGKSRLALELVNKCGSEGWSCGFLRLQDQLDFDGEWRNWQPDKPHLIVADYVIGREKQLGEVMSVLSERTSEFCHPVLILLLERQPWNEGEFRCSTNPPDFKGAAVTQSSRNAHWFDCLNQASENDLSHEDFRFEVGSVSLRDMNSVDLVEIVRTIGGDLLTEITDEFIEHHLRRIDGSGRPLIAYFLAQVLIDKTFNSAWNREDLLDAVLYREQSKRWKFAFDSEQSDHWTLPRDHPSLKLAMIATMIGPVDFEIFSDAINQRRFSEPEIRQAQALTDTPTQSSLIGFSTIVKGLEPDLLGEWMVLQGIDSRADGEAILEAAWSISPSNMVGFVDRASRDFPQHNSFQKVLAYEPKEASSKEQYWSMIGYILASICTDQADRWEVHIDLLRTAASHGHSNAQNALGLCCIEGLGTQADESQAFQLFQQAAEGGSTSALSNLGACYNNGQGVDRDIDRALGYYEQATSQGSIGGMANLAKIYTELSANEAILKKAQELYETAAQAGHHIAMNDLGLHLIDGDYDQPDALAAFSWFKRASGLGNVAAMNNLAHCFDNGIGVDQDERLAFEWYQEASRKGQADAMNSLAVCFDTASGTSFDRTKAMEWYGKAAALGQLEAICNLALCYLDLPDDGKNLELAAELFEEAALEGHVRSLYNLASLYLEGRGVQYDPSEAVGLFFLAARKGDRRSMYNLGICYREGLGIQANEKEAEAWLSRSGIHPI